MKKEDLFPDFSVTDIDVTIAGNVIKKPGHISCSDWRDVWGDYEDGYDEGCEYKRQEDLDQLLDWFDERPEWLKGGENA